MRGPGPALHVSTKLVFQAKGGARDEKYGVNGAFQESKPIQRARMRSAITTAVTHAGECSTSATVAAS